MESHGLLRAIVLHGGGLAWPTAAVFVWALWRLRHRACWRLLLAMALAANLLFLWARFIEPNLIVVRHTALAGTGASARIALIGDPHVGMFKDAAFLERVVARANALNVDAVLLAGDLTYEPQGQSLDALLAPLARLKAPAYAVLGNHDQGKPGPDIDIALRRTLACHGVQVIEGRAVKLKGFQLAGLGDRWAGKDDPAILATLPADAPTLVLAHNPDSAERLQPAPHLLMLAGHTHGGQMRIPFLYRHVLPVQYGFDRGEQWLDRPQGTIRVFTTAGVGESGLPLRLFNPPVIDVLDLQP
ncbi:metallophosphoesterase [Pseudoxanthomonas sp. GM95]|uniref:metallophosphoesterase n=1 Tax=Pseudoxanthomonas sp. GM95 TaxID=1881043 RepID=UPI001587091A|nr:metallophosphoesterase [Pseudoxanthomonas sp. GM95]